VKYCIFFNYGLKITDCESSMRQCVRGHSPPGKNVFAGTDFSGRGDTDFSPA
jgi:hypothetical protein